MTSYHQKPYDWKALFLVALAEVPVIAHACKAAGVNRVTTWRACETDPEFAKAWDDAMEEGIDRAEQEAFRRPVVRPRAWARQVEQLFDRLQDPEDLGHAVSNEVRGLIRQLRRKPDDA